MASSSSSIPHHHHTTISSGTEARRIVQQPQPRTPSQQQQQQQQQQLPRHHHHPPPSRRVVRLTSSSSSPPMLVRKGPLYVAIAILFSFPLLSIIFLHTSSSSSPSSSTQPFLSLPKGPLDVALSIEENRHMMAQPGGIFGPPEVTSKAKDGGDLIPESDNDDNDIIQILLVSTSANGLSLTTTWWFLNNKLDIPFGTLQETTKPSTVRTNDAVSTSSSSSLPRMGPDKVDIVQAAKSILQQQHHIEALMAGETKADEQSNISSWIVLPTSTLQGPSKRMRIGGNSANKNIHTILHFLDPTELEQLKTMNHDVVSLTTGQVMETILLSSQPRNDDPSSSKNTAVTYDTTTLSSLALGIAYVQTQTQKHY